MLKIVVNKNTNRIYEYIEPKENSQFVEEYTFYRIRANGMIDFNKKATLITIKKWIHQGYALECRNINHAKYIQAILRRDKATGFSIFDGQKVDMYDVYDNIAKKIAEEFPEDLI